MMQDLTPDTLLGLYRHGVFPMGHSGASEGVFIIDPKWRGVIPLAPFRMPSRLRRTLRQDPYRVTINHDFRQVMLGCAEPMPGRESTWINATILELYHQLHRQGHAHSIECWRGDELVGGLYGVSVMGAFFGESMFSRAMDASKIALVYLAARLHAGGYALLDTQFYTPHLAQFGCIEINRSAFKQQLRAALKVEADFFALPQTLNGDQLLQSIAHTS